MKEYTIKRYEAKDYSDWNAFIGKAKNATFLFHRDFMNYHNDRFIDYSLMVFDDKKLVSVLPANIVGDVVHSHQGLTYGGLVYGEKINAEKVEGILDCILDFFENNLVKTFFLKQIPSFYPSKGNGEVDFFLLRKGALLFKKEMNLAIDLATPLSISNSKLKHYRKVKKLDLQILEETQLNSFWELVLEPRLLGKHNSKPVHNVNEITFLKNNFPENIKQYSVYYDDQIIAGITVFETNNVVKSQYGATTKKGEELRALDFLFISLIEKYRLEGKAFFDMGVVSEENDKGYNSGLLKQKEELGCSIYNQDFYKIEITKLN